MEQVYDSLCVLFLTQLLSLTLDGLTGVAQDHMRGRYQTGANHMMLNVNLWSILMLGSGMSFSYAFNHLHELNLHRSSAITAS